MELELPQNISLESLISLEKDFRENLVTRKIHALITAISPIVSIKLIATKVNCSIDEVISSVETLVALGFIKNSEKGFIPTSEQDYKYTFKSENELERLLNQKERLLQASNDILESDLQADISLVVASDVETFKWYAHELQKLNDKFLEISSKLKNKDSIVTSVTGALLNRIQGDKK